MTLCVCVCVLVRVCVCACACVVLLLFWQMHSHCIMKFTDTKDTPVNNYSTYRQLRKS